MSASHDESGKAAHRDDDDLLARMRALCDDDGLLARMRALWIDDDLPIRMVAYVRRLDGVSRVSPVAHARKWDV